MFNVHNANMKPPDISFLLLAALLCAFPYESYTTDAHAAQVAAVTPIVRDVDDNGSHFLVDMAHFDFKTIHIPQCDCEKKSCYLIMAYRKEKGLPPIPLSKSLAFDARIHAQDLQTHRTFDDDDGDRRPSFHEFHGARRHHRTYDDVDSRRPSLHRRERDSHRRRVNYRRSDLPQPCRNNRIYHQARHTIQIRISVLQKQLLSSELALELM